MNMIHKVSRMLIVAAVVFVGGVKGANNSKDAYYLRPLNRLLSARFSDKGFTVASVAFSTYAFKKNEHAKNAAAHTVGSLLDMARADKADIVTLVSVGAADYGIAKLSEYLNEQGLNVNAVVKKCDKLPEAYHIRDISQSIVEALGNIVTQPQVIIYLLSNYIPNAGSLLKVLPETKESEEKSD